MESLGLKLKKTVRKVAALSVGAAMMGATITGALAAGVTLGDWKETFEGAKVVVGSIPVPGATEVTADHPDYGAATAIASEITTAAPVTLEESADVKTVGKTLNVGESIANILTTGLDESDLSLLSDQVFEDGVHHSKYDYEQEILFESTDTGIYSYEQDKDRENSPTGDYLKFEGDEDRPAWTYKLEFKSGDEINVTDEDMLEGQEIMILGKPYTIIDAHLSSGSVDKLTLLSGEQTVAIKEGEEAGSGVKVEGVSDETPAKCVVVLPDGEKEVMEIGEIIESNGLVIGLLDAIPMHEQGMDTDMCKLAIGAHKIELEDNKRVKVNGEEVKYSKAHIMGSGQWEGFNITYAPENDLYLAPGESLEDPIFGSISVVFNEVVEENPEEIVIDASASEEATLTVDNIQGDSISELAVCVIKDDKNMYWGVDDDEPLVLSEGTSINSTQYMNFTGDTTFDDASDFRNIYFLYSEGSGDDEIFHIGEIDSIDLDENKATIKVIDTDDTYEVDINSTGYLQPQKLSEWLTIHLTNATNENATIVFDDLYYGSEPRWQTKNGGYIYFLNNVTDITSNTTCAFKFAEDNNNIGDDTSLSNLTITLSYDSADEEFSTTVSGVTTSKKDDENSDIKLGRTSYGTRVLHDSDSEIVKIWYPEDVAYADVKIGASATTGGELTYNLVLDSEIEPPISENVIVVGGPCANKLAASLLGSTTEWPACQGGFEAGKGILQLVESGDNVALVVAGYSADDTQAAAEDLVNEDKLATVADETKAITPIEVA